MAFIDYDYFSSIYGDSSIPSDDATTIFARSSDIIDIILGGKTKFLIDCGSDFISGEIRRAIAAEAEFIFRNGGVDSFDSTDNDQVSLGKFSYRNYTETSTKKSSNCISISPVARSILENCGLLNRSIFC